MTTNHPARGPASLDRLHQIREILSKAAAQSDGGNLGYAMADAVKVIDGAIAVFGTEPQRNPVLAYADSYRDMAKRGVESIPVWSVITDLERNIAPLYTAPTAQVVPTFDEWLAIRGNKPLGWVKDAMRESYDACRAAMLQADNSPVTPDGWVMVPKELTPEMMRAVQIRSELGGYATSNLSGAYNMFSEFWNVAVSAAPKVDDL